MDSVLSTYIKPYLSEVDSLESTWRYAADFGEYYPPLSDNQLYPRLVPVYNGKVLDIRTEFVHASLSGISIKHYYGKCFKEDEEEMEEEERVLYGNHQTEEYDFDWFDAVKKDSSVSWKEKQIKSSSTFSSSSEESFEYRESFCVEGQPLCTLPKINYRNSFWNIHQPELCKLTWGQKYVGTTTVTDHLHEHLIQHGPLCEGFHTVADREFMLNRELDEYVRLKVLECPRKLPPDEPLFNFKSRRSKSLVNPKCKTAAVPELQIAINDNERYLQLSDDEEELNGRNVRRMKEEFCLTIGKHIRRPPITQQESYTPEDFVTPEHSTAAEEEGSAFQLIIFLWSGSGIFYYNWFLYCEEQPYEEEPDNKLESVSISLSEPDALIDPCPPLMMDEFCRSAGKVDFSDLRCDPDF